MREAPAAALTGDRRQAIIAAALVVVSTAAVYWPALDAGFLGDDFMILHRLRALGGAADVLRFFRGEFFEYYRPLGFVSHAVDWAIAGADARQFHLTNLLLHTINCVLVLLLGRALAPGSLAGPLAALLFAFHASNHEAVVWISARFDLLATCLGLAALLWSVRGGWAGRWAAPLLFAGAVLSKESVVALPIAVAAWNGFGRGATRLATARAAAPWVLALVVCSALRAFAGGISPVGGASRLPKLVAFGIALGAMILLADGQWLRTRDWLRGRRAPIAVGGGALIVTLLLAAALSEGPAGRLAREKLSVAGFTIWYLTTPVLGGEAMFADPSVRVYWVSGGIALALAAIFILSIWRPLVDDNRMWFLAAFLFATLLPISALTEGKRYLYLPSAAGALIFGVLVTKLHERARIAGLTLVGLVVIVSAGQIAAKTRDWVWAGRMTADGARLVDAALSPACGAGHVVFLTSPVGVRGVYTHFYYETFEVPRGCMPELFQVVARLVRVDTRVAVRWNGPGEIVMTVPSYRDNLLLSGDLRAFNTPFRAGQPRNMQTPLGLLRAETAGDVAVLTLLLTPEARRGRIQFFYYSDGQIHALESSP